MEKFPQLTRSHVLPFLWHWRNSSRFRLQFLSLSLQFSIYFLRCRDGGRSERGGGWICPHSGRDRGNGAVKIWRGRIAPSCPLEALTALEAGCMSQAITNAAKAEVGLDRRIMQSYPLIYQSSAPLNESNAQISRGAEKNNITYLLNILLLM